MSARLTSASASVVAEPVVRAIVNASSSAAISSTGRSSTSIAADSAIFAFAIR